MFVAFFMFIHIASVYIVSLTLNYVLKLTRDDAAHPESPYVQTKTSPLHKNARKLIHCKSIAWDL